MFAARRVLFTPSTAIRHLSATPTRLYVPRATKPPITWTKTAARPATSRATPGQGNPDIVEQLPNTVDEVDVDAILGGAPAPSPSPTVPARTVENGGGVTFTDETPPPPGDGQQDWYTSFHGLSSQPFPKEAAEVLMAPLDPIDVEIKPDGLLYLPEIKYRRILNRAFGPGGWGLAPRSGINVSTKTVSREYALVCLGRMVSVARGEQEYFDPEGIPTAAEGAKSNALMRCCKDLGVASELWDPRFIREFKAKYCVEAYVEHAVTKKVRKLWRRKDAKFEYPYQEKGK